MWCPPGDHIMRNCPKKSACSGQNTRKKVRKRGPSLKILKIFSSYPWDLEWVMASLHIHFLFWNLRRTHTDLAFYYTKKPFQKQNLIWAWEIARQHGTHFRMRKWSEGVKAFPEASLPVGEKGKTETRVARYLLQPSGFLIRPTCLSACESWRREQDFVCKKTANGLRDWSAKFWSFSPRILSNLSGEGCTMKGRGVRNQQKLLFSAFCYAAHLCSRRSPGGSSLWTHFEQLFQHVFLSFLGYQVWGCKALFTLWLWTMNDGPAEAFKSVGVAPKRDSWKSEG